MVKLLSKREYPGRLHRKIHWKTIRKLEGSSLENLTMLTKSYLLKIFNQPSPHRKITKICISNLLLNSQIYATS